MKLENEIREELQKISAKMVEVIKTEGNQGFRFLHLSVALAALTWALGKGFSPSDIDGSLEKLQQFKSMPENKNKGLLELLEELKNKEGVDISVQVINKNELSDKLAEMMSDKGLNVKEIKTELPTNTNKNEEPSFMSVLSDIEKSREYKEKMSSQDITKTKEFESLSKKLGIKF